jgi:hypothetical protein
MKTKPPNTERNFIIFIFVKNFSLNKMYFRVKRSHSLNAK